MPALAKTFPDRQRYWAGGDFVCLGEGQWSKQLGLGLKVKAYRVAVYVEEAEAARQLQSMQLADSSQQTLSRALLVGNFRKVVELHMLRNVPISRFKAELQRDLEPRLKRLGGTEHQPAFMALFDNHKISEGTCLTCLWEPGSHELTGDIFPPGTAEAGYAHAQPTMRFASQAFCEALYSLYLDEQAIVPEAQQQFVASASRMLTRQAAG